MFTWLTPILPVGDVREELAFCQQLGFEQHTDPDESYPVEDFVVVAHGDSILFGAAVRLQSWGRRMMTVRFPSYAVTFEEA